MSDNEGLEFAGELVSGFADQERFYRSRGDFDVRRTQAKLRQYSVQTPEEYFNNTVEVVLFSLDHLTDLDRDDYKNLMMKMVRKDPLVIHRNVIALILAIVFWRTGMVTDIEDLNMNVIAKFYDYIMVNPNTSRQRIPTEIYRLYTHYNDIAVKCKLDVYALGRYVRYVDQLQVL